MKFLILQLWHIIKKTKCTYNIEVSMVTDENGRYEVPQSGKIFNCIYCGEKPKTAMLGMANGLAKIIIGKTYEQ